MQVGGVLMPPQQGPFGLPPINLPTGEEVGDWLDGLMPKDPAAEA